MKKKGKYRSSGNVFIIEETTPRGIFLEKSNSSRIEFPRGKKTNFCSSRKELLVLIATTLRF